MCIRDRFLTNRPLRMGFLLNESQILDNQSILLSKYGIPTKCYSSQPIRTLIIQTLQNLADFGTKCKNVQILAIRP